MPMADPEVPTVVVVGAGRMGRGIAIALALAGVPVVLLDVKDRTDADRFAAETRTDIGGRLDALVTVGALPEARRADVLARIRIAGRADAAAALAKADIVFEGVSETRGAKEDVLAFLSDRLRDDAVLASTTSTMLSTELAALVPHPERFLNAHWLNPAFLMPIVEVSPHPGTAPEAVAMVDALLRRIGKRPVRVSPSAGYVVPRLQALVLNEAARMAAEGVATPAEIDEAVRLGFGFRYATVGPLEFIDISGLEMVKYASGHLAAALGDRFTVAPEVEERIAEGRLGLRSGSGFYEWDSGADDDRVTGMVARQWALLDLLGAQPRLDAALD